MASLRAGNFVEHVCTQGLATRATGGGGTLTPGRLRYTLSSGAATLSSTLGVTRQRERELWEIHGGLTHGRRWRERRTVEHAGCGEATWT